MKFKDLVGQVQAKRELAMRLEAFSNGVVMPSLMFIAARGKGKTTVAALTGLEMAQMTNGERRFIELNCASLKNMGDLWDGVMLPRVNDRDVTILFDECHMLKRDIANCLLTVTNPNETYTNSYTYKEMTVNVDMRRQSFFFATTEPQMVITPLMNRCRRIELEEYTQSEMVTILKRYSKGITYAKNVAEDVASTLRNTPRQAVQIANDVRTYLQSKHKKDKYVFTMADWTELKYILSIYPLGLTKNELHVLQAMEGRRDNSLTYIASKLQMTPGSVQKDLELHLMRSGLMTVDTGSKRNLTQAGQQYLVALSGV